MAENPLFYKTIVPLNREQHRTLHLDGSASRFKFAAEAHVVPLVIDEFEIGSRFLPILFTPGPAVPTAVFLLGSRPGENRFVDDKGNWTAGYIPAFLRRYPFIIGEVPDADPLVCIDQDSALLGASGDPLFDKNGEHETALAVQIRFINEYYAASQRTDAFLATLAKLDLFRIVTIEIRMGGQESRTLHGLMTIDLEKLSKLPDADFLQLRVNGYLPAIYAHIWSLAGIESLGASVSAEAASDKKDKPTRDKH